MYIALTPRLEKLLNSHPNTLPYKNLEYLDLDEIKSLIFDPTIATRLKAAGYDLSKWDVSQLEMRDIIPLLKHPKNAQTLQEAELNFSKLNVSTLEARDLRALAKCLPYLTILRKLGITLNKFDASVLTGIDIWDIPYFAKDLMSLRKLGIDLSKFDIWQRNWSELITLLLHLTSPKKEVVDLSSSLYTGLINTHTRLFPIPVPAVSGEAHVFTPPHVDAGYDQTISLTQIDLTKDIKSQVKKLIAQATGTPEEQMNSLAKLFWQFFGRRSKVAHVIYEAVPDLQKHVPHPFFAGDQPIKDFDNNQIFKSEGLDYEQFKSDRQYAYTKALGSTFKVPQILHSVYAFGDGKTEEQRAKSFKQHNPYHKHNAETTQAWTHHYIWLNNLELIPQAIKTEYERYGYTFRLMEDLAQPVEGDDWYNGISGKLVKAAHHHVSQKEFGVATDVMRYLAEYVHGGVYVDGDLMLFSLNSLEELMQTHKAFVGQERHFDYRIGNAFIASEPKSTLMKNVLSQVHTNLFDKAHAADYVKYSATADQRTLVSTGPVALTIAAAKISAEECAILPYSYIYTVDNCKEDRYVHKEGRADLLRNGGPANTFKPVNGVPLSIGRVSDHDFASSWIVSREEFDYRASVFAWGFGVGVSYVGVGNDADGGGGVHGVGGAIGSFVSNESFSVAGSNGNRATTVMGNVTQDAQNGALE